MITEDIAALPPALQALTRILEAPLLASGLASEAVPDWNNARSKGEAVAGWIGMDSEMKLRLGLSLIADAYEVFLPESCAPGLEPSRHRLEAKGSVWRILALTRYNGSHYELLVERI